MTSPRKNQSKVVGCGKGIRMLGSHYTPAPNDQLLEQILGLIKVAQVSLQEGIVIHACKNAWMITTKGLPII
jgi:hypothetical protein